jgi:DNA-directed RNA polymerase subunit RPC12/RpoP
MFLYKKIRCPQCDHALEEFEHYTVINEEIYCQDCSDEYIKEELLDNFWKYRDLLMEEMGFPALEAVYG